jgi:hypothetical protein
MCNPVPYVKRMSQSNISLSNVLVLLILSSAIVSGILETGSTYYAMGQRATEPGVTPTTPPDTATATEPGVTPTTPPDTATATSTATEPRVTPTTPPAATGTTLATTTTTTSTFSSTKGGFHISTTITNTTTVIPVQP